MFQEYELEQLPDDPHLAIDALCKLFRQQLRQSQPDDFPVDVNTRLHENYVEGLGILQSLLDSCGIEYEQISLDGTKADHIRRISEFFGKAEDAVAGRVAVATLDAAKQKHQHRFNPTVLYRFSNTESERVQALINELRELIASSERFEEDHRRRLLQRLERLQTEVHKAISDLDRFWGLIGDGGVVLNRLGQDAKPIVDRIRELASIVWRAQARGEGLPAPDKTPFLDHADEHGE